MSGIEIAGLVLAVIPLFISTIEHYEDGLRPFRVLKLVVYRQELAQYRTKLMTEYSLYNNALEELLVDVVTQQELRSMIDQGYGPLWKDTALEDKLGKRLGRTYATYFLVMKQMQEVMARIGSLLDIQRQGNVGRNASLSANPADRTHRLPLPSSNPFCSHTLRSTPRPRPQYTNSRRG